MRKKREKRKKKKQGREKGEREKRRKNGKGTGKLKASSFVLVCIIGRNNVAKEDPATHFCFSFFSKHSQRKKSFKMHEKIFAGKGQLFKHAFVLSI